MGSLFIAGVAHAETTAVATNMNISATIMPVMSTSSMPTCVAFSRSLGQGSRGDDVKELQVWLKANGFLSGEATGYFGGLTKSAVVKFQKDGGISATGFFGELSRKHHQMRCGGGMGDKGGDGKDGKWGTSTPPTMGDKGEHGMPCMMASTSPCMGGEDHPKTGSSSGIVACTMIARLCSDGTTMMPRDNMCNWHPEGCPRATSTIWIGTTTPPHMPSVMGSSSCPEGGCKPSGMMCTMEMKLCPSGKPMPRDNMCGWHPESCGSASTTISTGVMTY